MSAFPPRAMTRGTALGLSIVSLMTSVAHSGRAHARAGRPPPLRMAHGSALLARALRGRPAHPASGSTHHRAEPRDLRRPGADLDSRALAGALHGLGRAVRHPGARLAHSPTTRLSRPARRSRHPLDA